MTELLNESPTASSLSADILGELVAGELLTYVAEGSVHQPIADRDSGYFYVGAIILSSDRLLLVESKPFRRGARITFVSWHEVTAVGRTYFGEVEINAERWHGRGRGSRLGVCWQLNPRADALDALERHDALFDAVANALAQSNN